MDASTKEARGHEPPERRSFLTRLGAVAVGTVVAIFPFAAGWGVVTSPLRRKIEKSHGGGEDDGFVRICQLDSVPANGIPRPFVVVKDVVDAWTKSNGQRVGEVYLSRDDSGGKPAVTAFTAECPHLGCAVEFDGEEGRYECPCHESGFAKDGKKLFGPSLRGLDPLDVKLKENGGSQEVWVRYQRFRTGIAERIPVA